MSTSHTDFCKVTSRSLTAFIAWSILSLNAYPGSELARAFPDEQSLLDWWITEKDNPQNPYNRHTIRKPNENENLSSLLRFESLPADPRYLLAFHAVRLKIEPDGLSATKKFWDLTDGGKCFSYHDKIVSSEHFTIAIPPSEANQEAQKIGEIPVNLFIEQQQIQCINNFFIDDIPVMYLFCESSRQSNIQFMVSEMAFVISSQEKKIEMVIVPGSLTKGTEVTKLLCYKKTLSSSH